MYVQYMGIYSAAKFSVLSSFPSTASHQAILLRNRRESLTKMINQLEKLHANVGLPFVVFSRLGQEVLFSFHLGQLSDEKSPQD